MSMNWQNVGIEAVRLIVTVALSVLVAALLFRKKIAPKLMTALEESYKLVEEASKTSKTLASLGGIKKAQWTSTREMEKAVGAELIHKRMPELQALKLVLPSDTWDQLEEFIEENPDGALQLYEKYGHLIPSSDESQNTETYMF